MGETTPPNPTPSPSASDPTPVTPPAVTPAPGADPAAPTTPPADPKPADPAQPADPAKPPVLTAPEKYDFTKIKMPDGIEIDTPMLDALAPKFKELGLPQEAVEKLVVAQAEQLVKQEEQKEADFKTWMETTTKEHVAAIKKEWGTEYDANLNVAQRGMARFFDAEAKKLLDETGLGNHPAFVKAFYQIGKMVSEDQLPGSKPAVERKSLEAVLYPNMQ